MIEMTSEIIYQDVERTNPFIFELKKSIDWDRISETISQNIPKKKNNSGRPRFPVSQMLRILILQETYNLSDDAMEVQINGSIYFKFFLDMSLLDKSPDSKTIWSFKETLRKLNLEQTLFLEFHKFLAERKIKLHKGNIVDASFVKVPVQRNTRAENQQIKNDEIPPSFKENENKMRQKDTDARWTKKNGKSHYGYKNHIATATNEQFITAYEISAANVHDSQVLAAILSEGVTQIYGDSAYRSEKITNELRKKGVRNFIHHRKYRDTSLTEKQLESNRRKSKTRAKVEHIFAWFRNCMNRGLELRCIGIDRVRFRMGLRNTVYNMLKYVSITA